jgi:hypothetical protein
LHPLFENQPLNWRGGACLIKGLLARNVRAASYSA